MKPKLLTTRAALVPAYSDKVSALIERLEAELWVLDLDSEPLSFALQTHGDEWRLMTRHTLPGVLQVGGSPEEVRSRLEAHGWVELGRPRPNPPDLPGARQFRSATALAEALEELGLRDPRVEPHPDGRHFTVSSEAQESLIAGLLPNAGTSQMIVFSGAELVPETVFPTSI